MLDLIKYSSYSSSGIALDDDLQKPFAHIQLHLLTVHIYVHASCQVFCIKTTIFKQKTLSQCYHFVSD